MQDAPDVRLDEPAQDIGFHLAPDVHACATAHGCVILDLKRDRYLGFGLEESELLAGVVEGWPDAAWTGETRFSALPSIQAPNKGALQLCESLLGDGLLTRQRQETVGTLRADRIDMKADFVSVGDELEVRGHIRWGHVASFAVAYFAAWYSLQWRPLASTVALVRRKKMRNLGTSELSDVVRMARLVDIFRRLRPFVFAAEGHCLLHALTLVKFLDRYRFHPEWVIGVATQPWSAHSWVQSGKYLLDTNPEKVGEYTPILVV